MAKHKWLTEKQILRMEMDGSIGPGSTSLIIADRREMRKLCQQVLREVYLPNELWEAIFAMIKGTTTKHLEATADD